MWGNSLPNEQKAVQGKVNLPLPSHMLNGLGAGGQESVKQFTNGFPVIGILSEPGVYPKRPREDPPLAPHQLPTSAKYSMKARMWSVTDPHEGQVWEDA